MPLDPQAERFIAEAVAAGARPTHTLSIAEARQALRTRHEQGGGTPPAIASVVDRQVPGPAGSIRVRVYTPFGSGPFPVLVYLHGGGWLRGDLETHDRLCRYLADGAACLVVSVDYRLAPEHTFPAPVEDTMAATEWVAAHAAEIGADPTRIAVGGDSAGGNLAAVVALLARERGRPRLVFQLLVYPVTSYAFDTPSYHENATGYVLTKADMEWYWHHYLPDAAAGRDVRASPLLAADLGHLPPALVITAEYDPLRDEGEAYAARLREAGVPATTRRYPGMIHGFFALPGIFDQGQRAIDEATAVLRASFTQVAALP